MMCDDEGTIFARLNKKPVESFYLYTCVCVFGQNMSYKSGEIAQNFKYNKAAFRNGIFLRQGV